MFKKYVLEALAKFYKLIEPTVDKLKGRYEKNKKNLPGLNLDGVFKVLQQSSCRLASPSDRDLYNAFSTVISAIDVEEGKREDSGEKLPAHLVKFRNDMQEQAFKPFDNLLAPSAPSLSG